MIQPIQITDQVYAVAVPEGATEIGFRADCLSCILPDSKPGRIKWLTDIEEWMYEQGGEWEAIGTTKEVTEEQAMQIVEHDWDGFKDYGEVDLSLVPWMRATDSLRSLLTSKGIDQNKNYVLIRKL